MIPFLFSRISPAAFCFRWDSSYNSALRFNCCCTGKLLPSNFMMFNLCVKPGTEFVCSLLTLQALSEHFVCGYDGYRAALSFLSPLWGLFSHNVRDMLTSLISFYNLPSAYLAWTGPPKLFTLFLVAFAALAYFSSMIFFLFTDIHLIQNWWDPETFTFLAVSILQILWQNS